jgi:tetratricopeptide (TPR) repeat protein
MMLSRFEDAYHDALKAIELNKSYSKVYDRAVRCCLIIGEIQGAEKIIKDFRSHHPDDPTLDEHVSRLETLKDLLVTATQTFKASDYTSCMKTIEKCLEISPKYLMVLQLKASCLEATSRFEEALELRDKILSTDLQNPELMRDKGIALHRVGKLHEAMQVLDAAAKKDPRESETVKERRLKIKMMLEKASLGELKIENLRRSSISFFPGQEHLIEGRFNEAVQTLTEVISIDPGSEFNRNLYEHRGEANFYLRYYAAAFVDFSEALKLGNETAHILYMRACCHHAMGQFEGCLLDCEASMQIQWAQHTQTLYDDVSTLAKATEEERKKLQGKFANSSQDLPFTRQTLTQMSHDQFVRMESELGKLQVNKLHIQAQPRQQALTKSKCSQKTNWKCSVM